MQAANVTLAWDPSVDSTVIGYTVRYGTNSGQYLDFVVVGPSTNTTIPSLTEGASYYFTVSAYNQEGIESDPSAEIVYTVPGSGPAGFQPTLNPISNLNLNEDAGQQSVALTGISAGADGLDQLLGLGITASSSNPLLIPNPTVNYTSPATAGSLTFTPGSNAAGTAVITVTVNNFKATSNLFSRTFTVTVSPINDAPTLNPLPNLAIAPSAGPQTVALNGITSGAANETQVLAVTATSSNPGLIPHPTINYTSSSTSGSLSFAPTVGASGFATITVQVNDGQGQNSTVSRSFNVTIGNPTSVGLFVEAESGTVTTPMVYASDANASNGRFVYSQTDNQGTLSLNVNIPQSGDYVIWCRVLSANGGTDSFFVSVDGGAEQIYGTAQNTWSTRWQWTLVNIDSPANTRVFPLAAGQHTIVFRGRERSTMLDALYITSDRNFTPVQAPRLTIAAATTPSRGMQISFPGSVGSRYDLQASENLVNWTNIWSSPVMTFSQVLGFLDTAQTPSGRRFYRLQVR